MMIGQADGTSRTSSPSARDMRDCVGVARPSPARKAPVSPFHHQEYEYDSLVYLVHGYFTGRESFRQLRLPRPVYNDHGSRPWSGSGAGALSR